MRRRSEVEEEEERGGGARRRRRRRRRRSRHTQMSVFVNDGSLGSTKSAYMVEAFEKMLSTLRVKHIGQHGHSLQLVQNAV
jgi:hypothetical protein